MERNWEWNKKTAGLKVLCPCLMVTAELDMTLPPSMTKHMHDWIPDLTLKQVDGAGHWLLQEAPSTVNSFILDWLSQKISSQSKI